MTFKKFEEIFKSRYPDGWVHPHGKFGGCEKNMKVTVSFSPNGKCYSYYGAYEDVLCKMGINTISRDRLASLEWRLRDLIDRDGKPDMFFGNPVDNSKEIADLRARIAEYEANWIVV